MAELTLLDAAIVLFILFKVSRAGQAELGNVLHAVVALLLLIALLLGLRLNGQLRDVLGGLAGLMEAVPGIGSKLLVILAAWFAMRLVREKLGHFLESLTPQKARRPLTFFAEGLRTLLLVGFILWIVEPWLAPSGPGTSRAVLMVRTGDAWVARLLRPSSSTEAKSPPTPLQPLHPPVRG